MTRLKKFTTTLPSALSALAGFTALELAQKIPVSRAAAMNDIHEQTFRKRYPHLIIQLAERRQGVTLHDAITLPPPPPE
jgi:hypothetical protein